MIRCTITSRGSNLDKQNWDEMSRLDVADDFEGALPATAGANPLGVLCCSVVGKGFGGVPFEGGVRGILLASLRSWPAMCILVVLRKELCINNLIATSKSLFTFLLFPNTMT